MQYLISTRTLESSGGYLHDCIERGFYDWLKDHDITALLNNNNQNIEKLAEANDALILTGGDDNPERLRVEIYAVGCFKELNKPVIGVCHGAFLLTHLFNGKMINVTGHRRTRHSVMYKYRHSRTVNSFHGSAIVEPPEHSEVLVTDEDNYVESWILDNVAAVVWHPEREKDHWIPDEIKTLLGA